MLVSVLLLSLLQSAPTGDTPLVPNEQARYLAASLEERLNLLVDVTERYRAELAARSRAHAYLEADRLLSQYTLLLEMIGDNVQQLPEEKRRRSKPLRKLEIELRRMIEDLQGARRNAPWDAQELFDNPLRQSESVRATILQLIFGKGLLKGK